jgi:hypothetical protein
MKPKNDLKNILKLLKSKKKVKEIIKESLQLLNDEKIFLKKTDTKSF